ncbi:DUF1553 domain-containing protein [Thalassoroseus pseudoceratinae]|uniref:DUF1553 domain-containing protein n=1 Tax=Thalassoroseus pseudoceratinae TaxID=2713176 RepID=UPI001421BAEE|nr:PSD1 and planctomycete cytochrome C domain-containing protein [Thalassoroseus pseudoceratinae]
MHICSMLRAAKLLTMAAAFTLFVQRVSVLADDAKPTPGEIKFFENEIRPLLTKHCFSCHGKDSDAEGELRLDGRAVLLHGGASGPAAVPGKPKESLLIEAVQYRSLEMPPNGKLPEQDIAKLVEWVEMGLPWPADDQNAPMVNRKNFHITPEQQAHWAFQPVKLRTPPTIVDPMWNTTTIDRFLYAAMQENDLIPVQRADRETLLRRVTYDLTGLPPTPSELADFLADEHPEAWEAVVDRLLASPRYGEHWGRHWLDIVRYADTAGNASDHPVPDAYKYRDYVIASFNQDKPYDEFIQEQIAGDLLAKDHPEQFEELTTATTYLAMARRFGYNDTNFLYFHLTIHDLISNLGESILGLSIGCARCHDHKFEPISAKDYYALYGIFESTTFTFPGAEEVNTPKELIPLVPPNVVKKYDERRAIQKAKLDQELERKQFSLLTLEGSLESSDKLKSPWRADKDVKIVSDASSPFTNVFPKGNQSVELPNSAGNIGFRRPIPTQNRESTETTFINLDFRNVSAQSGGDGYYRICLDHVQNYSPSVELFINSDGIFARDDAKMNKIASLKLGEWYNLQFRVDWQKKTFSGVVSSESGTWSFADLPFNPRWDGVANSIVIDAAFTDATKVKPQRQVDNLAVQSTAFPAAHENANHPIKSVPEEVQRLRKEYAEIEGRKATLDKETLYPTAYAVREGTPSDTRMQMRGEPDRLGEEVPRGFLTVFGGEQLAEDCQESGRRQLSQWLTSPDNPLPPRVIANRVWQYHFGRGIVATANDFGVRGEPPTHPALLDYLAIQLIQNGWSLKSLHREILLSRAYQSSSVIHAETRERDPTNRWLSHFTRRRLTAEEIRDSILQLSGELELGPTGPHPFPPVSKWRYSQHNPFDAVYESKRRSVYLMTQRIKRHPFLGLFDGADPNSSTARRETTTTPLQALFLMNDQFTHEQSQRIAERFLTEYHTDSQRLHALHESVWSRTPTEVQVESAKNFLSDYAAKLPNSTTREMNSLAAYTRVLLSSNAFLYVD